MNSGAKAEENISKFKERFHEELSKQFGINYEDQVLVSDKTSTASGAKSQGWYKFWSLNLLKAKDK